MTEKVANTINKALRGKTDNEKMKKLGEKYKRPSNINNLQTARLEPVLWVQVKNGTKSIDANRQKLIAALNLTLLPIVKALEELHLNKTNSGDKLAEYVGDAFRIAAGQICAINNERRESVKRKLTSKFKPLCQVATTSATNLLGDDFGEQINALDANKDIKMTNKNPQNIIKTRNITK
ncbi:uncharacterized protein LOC128234622 [Mya arenaria]|uniref:uncharacterized protein LOC128234622 n=1 Tax=Mya arenaria TaxID=6604 RepID=UPI0022E0C77D|nr:uncharacterized protein LOC128234622 [Mya arenaria]